MANYNLIAGIHDSRDSRDSRDSLISRAQGRVRAEVFRGEEGTRQVRDKEKEEGR